MKPGILQLALLGMALGLGQASRAQRAPGSDPIVLGAPVHYLALPTAQVSVPEGLQSSQGMPAWVEAKIARYSAKAYSELEGEDGTVYTEKDVISRQTGNALERTCTTNIASNTVAPTAGPSGSYGPGTSGDQIAVLRGDVITICN